MKLSLDLCRFGLGVNRLLCSEPTQGGSVVGKFEVYQDKTGEYRFRLKAGNGQVVASGQAYTTKKACLNGIESIRKNAPDAPVHDQTL